MKRFFAWLHGRVSQAYQKLFPNVLKKRTWWPIFVVGIILVTILGAGFAHAGIIDGFLETVVDTFSHLLLELAKLCIFLAIFFLRFFITLASYNNYIDVSVVKLGWVMVRDVANMFFIVGLLVIAFATILGFESYEWKHGVVKIVMMAILINFSNLIAQLIIDVAHIFTITFLNAVSATAGGNLITLFGFDKILSLVSGPPDALLGTTRDGAGLSLFAASVMAFGFALLAALAIGSYLLVMIARIVVLWALIILSPLAFMLYAVPKGEDYAHEWWSEFSKHVIVAPVMVFFLWLAFATFGTGQIISEIQDPQKNPGIIQINSTGEEQSVSLTEISTWENMASFLLGIAFLFVGLKKTQDTGAEGSHLIGSAMDFSKNAITVASGYAVGRWIVGKGMEHGSGMLHATGEYASLGGSKLLDKTPYLGAAIRAPGRYLRDSAARRHEALHHREKEEELKIKEAVGKFNAHPTGLLGKLTISHDRLAEQEARTKLADREAHTAEGKYLAEAVKNLAKSTEGQHRYEHLAEYETKKNLAEREEKAIYSTIEAKLRLEDLTKNKEIQYDEEYAKLVEAAENEKRVGLNEDQKKELYEKGIEDKFLRDAEEEKRRAKFTAEEESRVLEMAVKERGGRALREDEKKKVLDEARNEIVLDDKEREAITAGVKSGSLLLTEAKKAEMVEEAIRKNASEAVSEKQRAALRRKAAQIVGGEIEVMALENEAKRPVNKYAIEQGRIIAGIVDEQRIQEGKKRKAVRIFQMKEAQDDIEDYKDYVFDEHSAEGGENFRIIREVTRAREKRKITGKELTDEEAKQVKEENELYKNAVQAQSRNLSSMYSKNYGKYIRGMLVRADKSFEGVDFNDHRFRHILDMALESGKTLADFSVVKDGKLVYDITDKDVGEEVRRKQANIQHGIGEAMKDKKNVLMRGSMVSRDKAAYEHNNLEDAHMYSIGRDTHGDEVVVPTALMTKGQFASGSDRYATGDHRTGIQRIGEKVAFMMSEKTIDKVDPGSIGSGGATKKVSVIINEETGDAVSVELIQKFSDERISDLAARVGDMSADAIARLPKPLVNSLLGGQIDQSSFDHSLKRFKVANGVMFENVGKQFERFQKNYQDAINDTTKQQLKKSIRNYLSQGGVSGNDLDILVDKIAIGKEEIEKGKKFKLDEILYDVTTSRPDASS